MKKLLLIILSLSLITSCKKDGLITDRKTVTYQVSCESCSVSYRDNADKAQSQHVVGQWQITFSAARMLEASMEISRTAGFANVNHVEGEIKINGLSTIKVTGTISANGTERLSCSTTLQ